MALKHDLHTLVSEKMLDPQGPVSHNLLSLRNTEVMKGVLKDLEKMEKVSLILQKDDCTIWEARQTFDWAIKQWPTMRDHLAKDAKINADPHFLSAVCKVIAGDEDTISITEKHVTSVFLGCNLLEYE